MQNVITPEDWGRAVKEARTAAGMSQEDLAREIGTGASTISQWETGYRYPSLYLFTATCRVFNLSADEILGIGGEHEQEA